jgi:histidinol-phosphate aminotransferase
MPAAGPGPSPRAAVAAIAPYVPGAVPPAVARALKLASNENPFGPSPLAVEAARLALDGVNRYPAAGAPTLRAKLAAMHGVAPDQVLVGAGSDETLYLLANTYLEPGRHAVMADPAYGIHRISARAAGATVIAVRTHDDRDRLGVHDLPAMAGAARSAGTRGALYIANPHNPTGTVVGRDALAALLDAVPDDWLIVVDEAYWHFVEPSRRWTALELLGRHPGLVVTRTFSKAYGLAGMRVGYAVAAASVLEPVGRIRPPFNVSAPALAAAEAALDDDAYLEQAVADTLAARVAFEAGIDRIGLLRIPSQANFALVESEPSGGHDWPAALAADAVSVRPGETLGVPGWTRVSLPRPEDVDRVLDVIRLAVEAGKA